MKRRAWKWVLGILAVVALALGPLLWNAHSRATAVFEHYDGVARESIAAIRARPISRTTLYEPVVPGDAYTWLVRFLQVFAVVPDIYRLESNIPGPQFNPAELDEFIAKHAGLIKSLRHAYSQSEFVPNFRYEDGWAVGEMDHETTVRLAKFLRAYARRQIEKGHSAEALDAVLLGLAAGHDSARSVSFYFALNQIACEEVLENGMKDFLAGHAFQAGELESFARNLDRLRETRPGFLDALDVHCTLDIRMLAGLGLADADLSPEANLGRDYLGERSWRSLYSRRLALAGALPEMEHLWQRSRELRALPPHQRTEAARSIDRQARSSPNLIVHRMFPNLGRTLQSDAVALMNWTLLRVAVAIAWFQAERGADPERLTDLLPRYLPAVPECPLTGKPLGYKDGVVRSVGVDGVDVVWTVKRK